MDTGGRKVNKSPHRVTHLRAQRATGDGFVRFGLVVTFLPCPCYPKLCCGTPKLTKKSKFAKSGSWNVKLVLKSRKSLIFLGI